MQWFHSMFRRGASGQSPSRPTLILASRQGIEWTLIDADFDGVALRIARKDTLRLPADLAEADMETVGQWFRHQLEALGRVVEDAVVVIDRQDALLWTLTLPATAEVELQELVRCHVDTHWADRNRQPTTDYIRLSGDDQTSMVLAAGIPADSLQRAVEVGRAAGFNIRHASLSACSLDRFSGQHPGCVAHVLLDQRSAEILLTKDSVPCFAQTVRVHGSTPQQCARSLVESLGRVTEHIGCDETGVHPVELVCLLTADPAGEIAGLIQSAADLPTENIVLGTRYGLSQAYLESVGIGSLRELSALSLIAGESEPRETIDFLRPNRRSAGWLNGNRVAFRALAGGAAVALVATIWLVLEHHRLDQEIAALQSEQADVEEQIAHAEPMVQQHAAVQAWQSRKVNWSSEIRRFVEHLPANTEVVLTGLQGAYQLDRGPSLTFSGLARNSDEVIRMQRELAVSENGYLIYPHAITPSAQQPHYGFAFQFDAEYLSSGSSE